MPKLRPSTKAFEDAAARGGGRPYVLRLFVAGTSRGSTRAVAVLKNLCETHLSGRYELEVIDVYQEPFLAKEAQIIAVPTLVRVSPLPLRRVLGDLSDTARVLAALDLKRADDEA